MRRPATSPRIRHLGAVILLLAIAPRSVSGTGFFINQQSVRGLARVDAGNTVAADELGTIFFNPAGLPLVLLEPGERNRLALEIHEIIPHTTQRNRDSSASTPGTLGAFVPIGGGDARNPVGVTPVPVIYYARQLPGGRAALGIAVNGPFGLSTRFDRAWHGRYDAIDASLKTYNGSVVVAYGFGRAPDGPCRRADGAACRTDAERQEQGGRARVFVGGGVDLQRATTTLLTAIPNPLAPGGPTAATDATTRTEGDALTAGFNVGILWLTTPTTRVGVHYRSRMTHDVSGTSTFENLSGPLAGFNGTVEAHATIRLPDIAAFGGAWQPLPKLMVLGDVKWFNWSRFDEVRVRYTDGRPDAVRESRFQDAWSFAGGVESPVAERWSLRGGVHYDTTPTVDGFRDTTVPDAARLWLGAGTTYRLSDRLQFDVAFDHAFFRTTTVDVTRTFFDGTPLATTVDVRNDVDTSVDTIAASLRWRF